jgi:hypothetical protein
MNILIVLVFIFSAVAVISIRYKISMRIKITNPNSKYSFSNLPSITDLFPMAIKYKPLSEIKIRKKANTALVIFYLCFILNLISAAIAICF